MCKGEEKAERKIFGLLKPAVIKFKSRSDKRILNMMKIKVRIYRLVVSVKERKFIQAKIEIGMLRTVPQVHVTVCMRWVWWEINIHEDG